MCLLVGRLLGLGSRVSRSRVFCCFPLVRGSWFSELYAKILFLSSLPYPMVRRKKLYSNDEEFKERLLKGLPLSRRIFDYERVFKKGDLVRVREWDGLEQNYTYLRREKGFYVFYLRGEEVFFDDEAFDSELGVVWVLRGKDSFLSDADVRKDS